MLRWHIALCIVASVTLTVQTSDIETSLLTDGVDKRFRVWPTIREKKELDETADDLRQARERLTNGQMLKQPLLRFDILWRKFSGKRRPDTF